MKNETIKNLSVSFSSLNTDKVYFFSGPDYLRKIKLISVFENLKDYKDNPFDFFKKEADSKTLGDFLLDCDSPPMKASKKIAVLKRAEKLKSEKLKELFSYCENSPDFLCLIILYDESLKKEDTAFGLLEKSSLTHCAFEEMEEREAAEFIKEKFKEKKIYINSENAQFLYSLTGGESAVLENEIEKISFYLKGKEEAKKEDIKECCAVQKEENPYEIIDAVISKDIQKLEEITKNLLDSNTEPMAVISVFSAAAEKLFKMSVLKEQGLSGDFKTAYSMGIFYRELKAFNSYGRISSQKAEKLLKRCAEAENLLKTSSGRDPKILIKNIAYELKKAL
ncbi:MAG: DNA polymerase III subunit delta [Elusimicrobia bacterium]|nr:DNA polymerase III subunit delta [Elusimicrobiota bacterium]